MFVNLTKREIPNYYTFLSIDQLVRRGIQEGFIIGRVDDRVNGGLKKELQLYFQIEASPEGSVVFCDYRRMLEYLTGILLARRNFIINNDDDTSIFALNHYEMNVFAVAESIKQGAMLLDVDLQQININQLLSLYYWDPNWGGDRNLCAFSELDTACFYCCEKHYSCVRAGKAMGQRILCCTRCYKHHLNEAGQKHFKIVAELLDEM